MTSSFRRTKRTDTNGVNSTTTTTYSRRVTVNTNESSSNTHSIWVRPNTGNGSDNPREHWASLHQRRPVPVRFASQPAAARDGESNRGPILRPFVDREAARPTAEDTANAVPFNSGTLFHNGGVRARSINVTRGDGTVQSIINIGVSADHPMADRERQVEGSDLYNLRIGEVRVP